MVSFYQKFCVYTFFKSAIFDKSLSIFEEDKYCTRKVTYEWSFKYLRGSLSKGGNKFPRVTWQVRRKSFALIFPRKLFLSFFPVHHPFPLWLVKRLTMGASISRLLSKFCKVSRILFSTCIIFLNLLLDLFSTFLSTSFFHGLCNVYFF